MLIQKNIILLIADLTDARDVSGIFFNPETIGRLVIWPYSKFKIVNEEKNYYTNSIKYEALQVQRDIMFFKVVLWLDKSYDNIKVFVEELELQNISCIFMSSTNEVIEIIKNMKWILNLHKNFKIITNMGRTENNVYNDKAGIDLLNALKEKFGYKEKVMIFTSDDNKEFKVKQMKESNFEESRYCIGTKINDVNYFLRDLSKDNYKPIINAEELRAKFFKKK